MESFKINEKELGMFKSIVLLTWIIFFSFNGFMFTLFLIINKLDYLKALDYLLIMGKYMTITFLCLFSVAIIALCPIFIYGIVYGFMDRRKNNEFRENKGSPRFN